MLELDETLGGLGIGEHILLVEGMQTMYDQEADSGDFKVYPQILSLFKIWTHYVACGIFVPQPGI